MKVLITGYEPFDGFKVNPSAEVAKHFDKKVVDGHQIVGAVLPLDYSSAYDKVLALIQKHTPDYVLLCGQATRAAISIERIGINAVGKKPDNYGNTPDSDVIESDAPAAYFSSIDPYPIIEKLKDEGIPAFVSYHAGTYGCNWILFKTLHMIACDEISTKTTFVHVPPLPEQAIEEDKMTLATMELETTLHAIEVIISNL